jgi:hypothetical protein
MPQPQKWGFKEKRIADALHRVARKEIGEVQREVDILPPENKPPSGRSVILHLDDNLPAASFNSTTRIATLGEAYGYVYRRLNVSDETSSQAPDYIPNSKDLVPDLDELGQCNVKRVYNSTGTAYTACTFVRAIADNYGDLYVQAGILTTALTTTTEIPTQTQECSGQCKWVWSEDDQEWSIDTNSCSSTSTTPSVTLPTTTTTIPPCVCGNPSYTPTSSTPPPASCECAYPQFCGIVDEDCTNTFCVDGNRDQPGHPECSTTTSTSTTTTTCECTTTTSPSCGGGCDWFAVMTQNGPRWRKTADNCATFCPCFEPEESPTTCTDAHTDCQPIAPTTTTPCPSCSGSCAWWWSSDANQWYLGFSGCKGGCANPPPAESGLVDFKCPCPLPSEDGELCGTATTYCSPSTPSTPAATTTTKEPCEAFCETSSTSETSSTTTTTPDPCETERCLWRWDVGEDDWVNEEDNCPERCPCYPPSINGTEDCQLAESSCGTETTTTTVPPPCSGVNPCEPYTPANPTCNCQCVYECQEGAWVLLATPPGCYHCPCPEGHPSGPPCGPGTDYPNCTKIAGYDIGSGGGAGFGNCYYGGCACLIFETSTTTTTAAPTTTTTTTAAPALGCCSDPDVLANCEDLTVGDCASMHPGWDWNGPPAVCCTGTPSCGLGGIGDC